MWVFFFFFLKHGLCIFRGWTEFISCVLIIITWKIWLETKMLYHINFNHMLILSELRELVMDREAWRAVIHGVTKSWTWLSDWTEYYKKETIFLKLIFQCFYSWTSYERSTWRVWYYALFSCTVLNNQKIESCHLNMLEARPNFILRI